MRTSTNRSFALALTGAITLAACSTALAPKDLVNARTVYSRASQSSTAELNPTDMHTAKTQLDVAEASFAENGDTQNTRDQAYLAIRKIELAEVVARTMESNRAKEGVVDAMHDDQARAVANTSAALERSNKEGVAKDVAFVAQGVALKDEKSRREEADKRAALAEKRAAQLASDLSKFATVKQEPRGMVITLSGSVLFASAKWDLLPGAQLRLNEIADALTKEDPTSTMVVEGHTDSQGMADYNQGLSQHRAQAVRDYLVSRGVASDRIVAQGFGHTRSIADNKSPEGRANNRRVEIVVKQKPGA
jgi:outer membrane protein OmpA-like peptidoglycan-associated protein